MDMGTGRRAKGAKYKKRKKIIIAVSVAILLFLGVGMAYGWQAWNAIFSGESVTTIPKDPLDDVPDLKGRFSVLLLGADQRPGDTYYNSDSIILATFDPENKRISLLSIPRDTRIQLESGSNIKINSLAATKGPVALQQAVSDLTGLPVSGYVLTNFDGFKQIIDTLGGITINVEIDMYHVTGDKKDGIINLKKGVQKLDGTTALQYVRYRGDALADIARAGRQQNFLKSIAKELLQVSTIPKIPSLIPKLNEAVETNVSLGDMLKIAKAASDFEQADIVTQTLPGGIMWIKGICYWEVDPALGKKTMGNLLKGVTTDEIILYENTDEQFWGTSSGNNGTGTPTEGADNPPGSDAGIVNPPGTGSGDGTTNPPGTGNGTSNPRSNDGTVNPPGSSDGTVNPPGTGNGTTNPPGSSDGTANPPGTGNGTTNPPGSGDGTVNPPGTGSETTNPPENSDGTINPPGNGDGTMSPPAGGTTNTSGNKSPVPSTKKN